MFEAMRTMAAVVAVVGALGAGAVSAEDEPGFFRTCDGSYLGAALSNADTGGVRVERVVDGTPAQKSGLAKGDVLVSFAGEPVRSAAQLTRLVRETPPGRTVA